MSLINTPIIDRNINKFGVEVDSGIAAFAVVAIGYLLLLTPVGTSTRLRCFSVACFVKVVISLAGTRWQLEIGRVLSLLHEGEALLLLDVKR